MTDALTPEQLALRARGWVPPLPEDDRELIADEGVGRAARASLEDALSQGIPIPLPKYIAPKYPRDMRASRTHSDSI
jgi:hypothetical protein